MSSNDKKTEIAEISVTKKPYEDKGLTFSYGGKEQMTIVRDNASSGKGAFILKTDNPELKEFLQEAVIDSGTKDQGTHSENIVIGEKDAVKFIEELGASQLSGESGKVRLVASAVAESSVASFCRGECNSRDVVRELAKDTSPDAQPVKTTQPDEVGNTGVRR